MAEALREAYGDIFLIKESPSVSDKEAIEGKFKSFHNVSDNVAGQMSKTFFGLLPLAEIKNVAKKETNENKQKSDTVDKGENSGKNGQTLATALHYNIQIHLPPTKDIEVYNAIFKSLRTHLLDP
jgi:hypothetical protein